MIDLGTTDFYINVPSMPRRNLERYSTKLFDEWEYYIERTLTLPDYSLALEIEEGSIRGFAKITAVLGAVYVGIGNYGSFISGFQTIREQLNSVGDYLAKRSAVPFAALGAEPRVRQRGGALAELQRLFIKVQRGELTPQEAMIEAESLFGDEGSDAPEFMRKLEEYLEQAPVFHEQQKLPFDTVASDDLLPNADKGQKPRPSRPKPTLPPLLQFRVEVWRESKKGQKKVRVVTL
jgi:hypothetical protein